MLLSAAVALASLSSSTADGRVSTSKGTSTTDGGSTLTTVRVLVSTLEGPVLTVSSATRLSSFLSSSLGLLLGSSLGLLFF